MQLDRPHGQMSDSFLMSAFIILSGGLQDAYTYLCRGKVFANAQTGNIVLLGAAAPFLGIAPEKLEAGIRAIFARKGDAIVDTNLAAFRAGYAYAQKQTAQWEGCR